MTEEPLSLPKCGEVDSDILWHLTFVFVTVEGQVLSLAALFPGEADEAGGKGMEKPTDLRKCGCSRWYYYFHGSYEVDPEGFLNWGKDTHRTGPSITVHSTTIYRVPTLCQFLRVEQCW